MSRTLLAGLAGLVCLSVAPAARAYEVKPVVGGGTLEGRVVYEGKAPALPPVTRGRDAKICGADGVDESLVVGPKGALANAVITVEVAAGKKLEPTADAHLDQKGCTYQPHVQAVTVGSPFTIVNSDPLLHNVHAYLGDESQFNKAEPIKGQHTVVNLKKAGLLHLKCDVHNWMSAYVVVAANPYFAVTGADGTFRIADLPAGTYTVKIWHEKLAAQEMKVTIPAGGVAKAEVKLK